MRRSLNTLLDYFCHADTHAIIWPEVRVMFIKNGKCGTTCVSEALLRVEGLGPALTNRPGVPTLRYMQRLSPDDFNRFFIFTTVRDPFDRYISFYGDRRDRGQTVGSLDDFTRNFTLSYSYDRDFQDHARPQHVSLAMNPDMVLRYESLARDYEKLCTKLGVRHHQLPYSRVGTSRAKENKTLNEWYSSSYVADFVRTFYALDFEKAGYSCGSI